MRDEIFSDSSLSLLKHETENRTTNKLSFSLLKHETEHRTTNKISFS